MGCDPLVICIVPPIMGALFIGFFVLLCVLYQLKCFRFGGSRRAVPVLMASDTTGAVQPAVVMGHGFGMDSNNMGHHFGMNSSSMGHHFGMNSSSMGHNSGMSSSSMGHNSGMSSSMNE